MTGFGDELRRLLADRGMSLNELARRSHYDRGHLSKVVRGLKTATPELASRLGEVLGADLTALADSEHGIGNRHADGALELVELTRRAGRSDLAPATLETLCQVTDRLCRDYPAVPAPVVSDRARRYLRYTTGLLSRRVTLRQHRELLVIAGWLAALLACACYDAGDRATAEAARAMTLQLGEEAGHGELTGWGFEIAAWFALVEGRPEETVALSEAGLEHAGISNAGVQLTLQASRGYARMGEGQGARRALAAGQSLLDRLPVPEHPDHHFVFDAGKYEFYVGTVLTWLGSDDAAAEEHARHVVAGCRRNGTVRWPMRLAISELDLAMIATRRGDLDEAVSLGTAALGHGRRSAQLLPRAAELRDRLATRFPGERLTAEYGEALREETRTLADTR